MLGAALVLIGCVAQAYALWHIKSIVGFEVCMCVILLGLGFIFTTTNTLAMNEGREHAGEASALLGIMGYIVGGIVSPLVGIGEVLHSTAIVFVALGILIAISALLTRRLTPEM